MYTKKSKVKDDSAQCFHMRMVTFVQKIQNYIEAKKCTENNQDKTGKQQ